MKKSKSKTSSFSKGLAEELSKLLGAEVQVIDLDEAAATDPEVKAALEKRQKAAADKRHQVARLVEELLKLLQKTCCDKPEHNRKPKHADDVLAVNNAMQAVITHYGEIVQAYVGCQRSMMDEYLKLLKREMHPVNEQELMSYDLEMAAVHSMLSTHFELVARPGKIDYSNHYDKMVAMIKAWADGKETGKHEAGTTH